MYRKKNFFKVKKLNNLLKEKNAEANQFFYLSKIGLKFKCTKFDINKMICN